MFILYILPLVLHASLRRPNISPSHSLRIHQLLYAIVTDSMYQFPLNTVENRLLYNVEELSTSPLSWVILTSRLFYQMTGGGDFLFEEGFYKFNHWYSIRLIESVYSACRLVYLFEEVLNFIEDREHDFFQEILYTKKVLYQLCEQSKLFEQRFKCGKNVFAAKSYYDGEYDATEYHPYMSYIQDIFSENAINILSRKLKPEIPEDLFPYLRRNLHVEPKKTLQRYLLNYFDKKGDDVVTHGILKFLHFQSNRYLQNKAEYFIPVDIPGKELDQPYKLSMDYDILPNLFQDVDVFRHVFNTPINDLDEENRNIHDALSSFNGLNKFKSSISHFINQNICFSKKLKDVILPIIKSLLKRWTDTWGYVISDLKIRQFVLEDKSDSRPHSSSSDDSPSSGDQFPDSEIHDAYILKDFPSLQQVPEESKDNTVEWFNTNYKLRSISSIRSNRESNSDKIKKLRNQKRNEEKVLYEVQRKYSDSRLKQSSYKSTRLSGNRRLRDKQNFGESDDFKQGHEYLKRYGRFSPIKESPDRNIGNSPENITSEMNIGAQNVPEFANRQNYVGRPDARHGMASKREDLSQLDSKRLDTHGIWVETIENHQSSDSDIDSVVAEEDKNPQYQSSTTMLKDLQKKREESKSSNTSIHPLQNGFNFMQNQGQPESIFSSFDSFENHPIRPHIQVDENGIFVQDGEQPNIDSFDHYGSVEGQDTSTKYATNISSSKHLPSNKNSLSFKRLYPLLSTRQVAQYRPSGNQEELLGIQELSEREENSGAPSKISLRRSSVFQSKDDVNLTPRSDRSVSSESNSRQIGLDRLSYVSLKSSPNKRHGAVEWLSQGESDHASVMNKSVSSKSDNFIRDGENTKNPDKKKSSSSDIDSSVSKKLFSTSPLLKGNKSHGSSSIESSVSSKSDQFRGDGQSTKKLENSSSDIDSLVSSKSDKFRGDGQSTKQLENSSSDIDSLVSDKPSSSDPSFFSLDDPNVQARRWALCDVLFPNRKSPIAETDWIFQTIIILKYIQDFNIDEFLDTIVLCADLRDEDKWRKNVDINGKNQSFGHHLLDKLFTLNIDNIGDIGASRHVFTEVLAILSKLYTHLEGECKDYSPTVLNQDGERFENTNMMLLESLWGLHMIYNVYSDNFHPDKRFVENVDPDVIVDHPVRHHDLHTIDNVVVLSRHFYNEYLSNEIDYEYEMDKDILTFEQMVFLNEGRIYENFMNNIDEELKSFGNKLFKHL